MLGANPFKSETVAPMDLLLKYPGWQNTHISVEPINGQRSDVLDGKLPIWISAKNELYKGELPIWNHQRGGKPGFTFSNSLITPAFWTFALVKDDALGFYLSNLVNVLIGLFGMYLFLRLFFDRFASLFGAIVFMFSGFNAAWFFWHHVNTAIWSPWVLYSVMLYLRSHKRIYLPFVALSMFMLNVGGFPMVAVMTYLALAIMTLLYFIFYRYSPKDIFTTLTYLILFSIIGLMLSIPFVYPLVELLSWIGDLSSRHAGNGFKLYELKLFVNPYLFGYPQVEATFYAGILPVVFLVITLLLMLRKVDFVALYGLLLFLFALSISFALISPEILHQIPIINSSLLTRFSYLLDFSLAMISAFVIHQIYLKLHHKLWGIILILLLLSIQVIDQKRVFAAFNGPVPNASFYPTTPTIAYLQKNLGPFEHVIADKGYLIAGTLGGYGLNDWYAHSFHSKAEKKILSQIVSNPFNTPTSAMFDFAQINLESPYIDYLGIKAILSTSYSKYKHIALWNNNRPQRPAPHMPQHKLQQPFEIKQPITVNGIALLMATYGETHASSDVICTIQKENKTIQEVILDKEKIKDNQWADFLFEEAFHFQEGNYTLSLQMLQTEDAKALTVWSNKNETQYRLVVDNIPQNLSFKMALTQNRKPDTKYIIHNLEPNIFIFENRDVKPGAYFLPKLDINHKVDYTQTTTSIQANTKIHISYRGKKSGWIVLPMRFYPGWKAYVNGKIVHIDTFLDMLPAIPVQGEADILLHYDPDYNTYTYFTALLGILLLLFSLFKFKRGD